MHSTISITPSRADAGRGANGERERRYDNGSWGLPVLWNHDLSNRGRRSAKRKRSNGCKVIRGFGSQSGEKSAKEEVTNSLKSNVRSPPSPASWRHFLLKDVNQADDHGLPRLVELLESLLASSSWASFKTPARSLKCE